MTNRKKVIHEEDLHTFFFKYPHIIIENLDIKDHKVLNKIHEYKLNKSSIPDIYIETSELEIFCEIKFGKLKEKDLYQAIRYFNEIEIMKNDKRLNDKKFMVFLIGNDISSQLRNKAIQNKIQIKIIGKDLPDYIKICKNCRKAYDARLNKCIFCSSTGILEFINLKYP
ncbi:MAG: hypothetical protein ACP6IY_11225 [Promethearchaeia archaeon]